MRVWNPADGRILMPKTYGVGWDLNLGAVAARLGMIARDEDEPIGSRGTALAVAVAPAVAAVGLAAVQIAAPRLGNRSAHPLPTHWDLAGRPDRWATRTRALGRGLLGSTLPAAVDATLIVGGSEDDALPIAAAAASLSGADLATMLASLSRREHAGLGVPASLLVALAASAAWLSGRARAGRWAGRGHR